MLNTKTERFYDVLTHLKTPQQAQQFFEDLCTPAEINSLIDRWQVVYALNKGMSYREIHAQTSISLTTIGRVARSLKYGSGGYSNLFDKQTNSIK